MIVKNHFETAPLKVQRLWDKVREIAGDRFNDISV